MHKIQIHDAENINKVNGKAAPCFVACRYV